jgi:hypothetical protein
LVTKRKSTKTTSKKALEAKIAQLEGKLSQLSAQVAQKPAGQAQTAPPPAPKPAEAKPAEAPKPTAQTKAEPPVTLETIIERVPMGDWNAQKAITTGYSPENARAWARRHPDVGGEVPTTSWTLQKATITGYTAPSNRYFATKQRLAYHPPATNFTGYGVSLGHGAAQSQAPPPQQDRAVPKETGSSGGGSSKKSSLEEYENDYLARLDAQARETQEFNQAAAELAAKKHAESGSSSSGGSTRGTLPKGF